MAAPSSIIRQFQESLGVDLTSSDLARSNRHLSGGKNFEFTESGALTKRRGQHLLTSLDMTGGIWEFTTTGLDGIAKTELLGARERLYKLVEHSLTINNVGASAAVLSTAFDPTLGWYFRIHVGGVSVLNYNTGFGLPSDPTLYDLQQTIDALADFTASIPSKFQPKAVPAADVDTANDLLTLTGHNLRNGQLVKFTTSGSAPGGLTAGNIYTVVNRRDGTFGVSTDINVQRVNLTSQGTGTHTFTSVDIRAAYLQRLDDVALAAGGSTTLQFYMWEPIGGVVTGTSAEAASFTENFANVGRADWRKISAASCRGSIYFSGDCTDLPKDQAIRLSSKTAILKYDGQTLMRAGLLGPILAPTVTNVSTGTKDSVKGLSLSMPTAVVGTFYYRVTAIQVDKTGQRHESAANENAASVTTSAGQCPELTVNGSTGQYFTLPGYNTVKSGRVSGAQTGVLTITMSSSFNDLEVGDVAFFFDTSQGRFIQRIITAVSDSSITISSDSLDVDTTSKTYDNGGTVNVADRCIISNNFRLGIYRATSTSGPFALVDEIPVSLSGTAAYVYYDQTLAADLGGEYLDPTYPPAEPPPGSIVAANGDGLLISGLKYFPDTVYFSDLEDQESFPEATHNFTVGGTVSACGISGDTIAVTQNYAIDLVTGSLADFQFRVDRLASNIGCIAHDTMQNYNEGILNFLTHRGPYMLVNGRDLRPIGGVRSGEEIVSPLEKYFQGGTSLVTSAQAQSFGRSAGAVANIDRYYLIFVPHEAGSAFSTDGTQSQLFVFDYAQGAWMIWDNCYGGAGMASYNGDLHLNGRTTRGLVKFQPGTSEKDYVDFNGAITMRVETHDETLGQPGVFKKFLRLGIYILESLAMSTVNYVVKTYLDWDTSTARTSSTRVVTTQKTEQVKLKGQKARSLRVVFENAELEQAPVITGYEIEAARPYRTTLKD